MMSYCLLCCFVAVVSTAAAVSAQTRPAQTPTTMPVYAPILPESVQNQVGRDEDDIRDAWTHPADPKRLEKGIAAAEDALRARRKYQGAQWWETGEAQDWLTDLKHLAAMTPEKRKVLADAFATKEQFNRAVANKDYASAAELRRKCRQQFESVLGPDHPFIADVLEEIGIALQGVVPPDDALQTARDVLRIRQGHYKGNNLHLAASMLDVARLWSAPGHANDALELARRAMKMYQAIATAPDDFDVADSFRIVAICFQRADQPLEALKLCEEALAMDRRLMPGDNSATAAALRDVADCLCVLRRNDEAIQFYQQSLDMTRHCDGESTAAVASLFVRIGDCQQQLGELEPACNAYESALRIQNKISPARNPDAADTLNKLANCLQLRGLLDQALIDYEQALSIRESLHHEPDCGVATALNNLGFCLQALGCTDDALANFKRARRIYESLSPPPAVELADSYSNVAYCQRILGSRPSKDGSKVDRRHAAQVALDGFKEALKKYQEVRPPVRDRLATTWNNIAYCEQSLGRYDDAIAHFGTALDIRRQLDGGRSLAVAESLNNLASCLAAAGRTADAIPVFRDALAMRRQLFPGDHPDVAATLSGLGGAEVALGRWDDADGSLLEAARMKWVYLTHTFPVLSDAQKDKYLAHAAFDEQQQLSGLAVDGHCPPAMALNSLLLGKELLLEVARREQGQLLAASASTNGSEWSRDWKQYQELRRQYATAALADSHAQPASSSADPNARASAAAAQADSDKMQKLAGQIEQLEQHLRQTNPAYAARARLDEVHVQDVVQALRPDQALVEYTTFLARDGNANSPHYAAFVLHGGSGQVTVTDLGSASELNQLVREYRDLVTTCLDEPGRGMMQDINDKAAALYDRVLKPLHSALVDTHRLYLAPEGWLALFPFEALVTEEPPRNSPETARYLIEDKEIVYVNTGRDLTRLSRTSDRATDGPKTAVLVGNPDFDAPPQLIAAILAGKAAAGHDASDLRTAPTSKPFVSRPAAHSLGGGDERRYIPRDWSRQSSLQDLVDAARADLLGRGWTVTTLCNAQATEEAVESLHAPTILQLATHGYMLGSADEEFGWQNAFASPTTAPASSGAEPSWGNPLLQSMLIMAGESKWPGTENARFYPLGTDMLTRTQAARRGISDAEFDAHAITVGDGCLTAYEVSGMDLHGTQFVNLTACETGLGEITPRGVAGLRQGFLLAGARSLTMSMWEIPAQQAPKEAEDFYKGWLGDATHPPQVRYKAFRAAKLKLLAEMRLNGHRGAPHLWAGVVYVGDPGDLPLGSAPAPATGP